jgi:hypothetical protein
MEWKGIVLVPAAAGDSGGDLGAGDISPILAALFGNRTAACVLLFLQSYGEGHAMRIAETFGFGLNMTQRQLKRLEGEGVLLSRRVGNVRLFSFNQRNATVRHLQRMLEAELQLLPEVIQERFFQQRQRPRLSDKPLLVPDSLYCAIEQN